MACCSIGPPQASDPARKAVCGFCSIDCSSWQSGFLHGISMSCSFLQGISTRFSTVSPLDAVWYFFQYGLSVNFWETSSPPAGVVEKSLLRCWSTYAPSSFSHLGVCRAVSFSLFLSLSQQLCSIFLPFPRYVITEAALEMLMSSDFGQW